MGKYYNEIAKLTTEYILIHCRRDFRGVLPMPLRKLAAVIVSIGGLFTFCVSFAFAGADYESQLGHLAPRFVESIKETQRRGFFIESTELLFRVRNKNDAELLSAEYQNAKVRVVPERSLEYQYIVSVTTDVDFERVDPQRWIRRQFFIGIAYRADIDNWRLRNRSEAK